MDKVVDYKNEDSTAHITVTVKQTDVASRYEQLMQEYLKDAQMPGYRKGRVPKQVFEKKYAQALEGETANKLIDESVEGAIQSLERKVIRYRSPEVIDAKPLSTASDFVFTLKVDVAPVIEISNYTDVSAPKYAITVSDDDVSNELKRLQEQNAFVVNKNEAIASGDIVEINYVQLDSQGEAVNGTLKENFVFTVGNNQGDPPFDQDVIGLNSGDEKMITYADITYKVTINSVKAKTLPDLDDEFAQDVNEKFSTLVDLTADIKSGLTERFEREARNRRCSEVLEEIAKVYPFAIPEGMIMADVEMKLSQFARQMNMSEEQLIQLLGSGLNSLVQDWRKESEVVVRNQLMLEHIATKENITCSDDEFTSHAQVVADSYRSSVEELTKQVGEESFDAFIREQVRRDKALDFLYDKAKVTKELKLSIEEFTNLNSNAPAKSE